MFSRLFAPAFALAALLLCFNQANAQTDSAYFNLGRVKLLKNSTQHVTVKAEDLQRFPFANLSEAVNVWFSGYFSNASSLVYVIDGNLATDVNQYPIYDIEEITLIQNAVAQLNGISQQQQLIVVTTKRNSSGNAGVMLAGQANLVKLQTNRLDDGVATKGSNAFYQQYHVSAYKNVNQLHFGVSANYLRDVMPGTNFNTRTDLLNPQINRWRFNGYLNTSLWKGTVLDLTAGYVPQTVKQDYKTYYTSSTLSQMQVGGDENLFNGSLSLHSQLLPGLTNEVRAVYNNTSVNHNGTFITTIFNGANFITVNYTSNSDNALKNIVVYDELRYTKALGDFTFSPAINLNYRNVKDSTFSRTDNSANSYTINIATSTSKTYLLTPTLALSYKNALNLTAGLVHIISSSNYGNVPQLKKTFPFVTASANVSKLIDTSIKTNIKVYGSYAVSNILNDSYASLSTINTYGINSYINQFENNTSVFNYVYGKTFKTLSLGLTAGLFDNKLEVSYNYENRNSFSQIAYILYQSDSPYMYYYPADTKYTLHRLGLGFILMEKDHIQWKTQINVSKINQQINTPNVNVIYPVNPLNKVWTGGWTNRLQYKNLVGGIDVQYLFGKNINPQAAIQSLNSFALQNVYAGWQIKTSKLKSLEVFANGRNLIQNKNSILPEYRRYFGLGVQAGF